MAGRDWDAFARTLEAALDMGTKGGFRELFAPVMPDWRQEITSIRGGDAWAFFEWIGYATYRSRDGNGPGDGTPITMHGATIIEVDGDGLITSWRDYLDRKEPEDQIRAALRRDRGDQ